MQTTRSADGSSIAYDRYGEGSPVIMLAGAFNTRATTAPLAEALGDRFTVINPDRRGRGDSGDTSPYTVKREIEDIDALIAEAGGSAHLYGVSSGGALALEAAAAGTAVDRLAVYEVPYNLADDWPRRWGEYVEQVEGLVAEGRHGDALAAFMGVTGSSEEAIAGLRAAAFWPAMEAFAPTLAYDAACLGDGQPPAARLARITQPTLVATGGPHPSDAAEWVVALAPAADAIAAAIPHAQRLTIEGQGHVADPRAVAAVLECFFAD
jgi:pimeloyl-ACP methyl ester carboxylesterase